MVLGSELACGRFLALQQGAGRWAWRESVGRGDLRAFSSRPKALASEGFRSRVLMCSGGFRRPALLRTTICGWS